MKPASTEHVRRVVAAMEERARSRLQVSRELLGNGHCNDAVSRAYYAAFHSATLLFYCGGRVFSSHAQLVGAFNKEFVTTHLLEQETARTLHDLFELLQSADYDVMSTLGEAEARKAFERAASFVGRVISYARSTYPDLFNPAE